MLIRAQDKVEIVNLDNIASIYAYVIEQKDKGIQEKYKTEIKYHAGKTLNNRYLGTYSSEEKALKVLDMIQEKYLNANNFNGYVMNTVFEMPAYDEVNV